MNSINISQLEKSYSVDGKILPVLKGIDLTIPYHQITVLLGQSGCGKTTLLRLLGGLEHPDAGTISPIDGKIAFIFQEPRLMPWLTVYQNACFGLKKEEVNPQEIRTVLDKVSLLDFENAYPHQLSGGMQQRLSLARGLAYKADIFLMDEPFAALDYFTRSQMQQELLQVYQDTQITTIFVTHSIEEAITLGDHIAIIEQGVIKKVFDIPIPQKERDLTQDTLIALRKEIVNELDFL